jgi:hypothetical protein
MRRRKSYLLVEQVKTGQIVVRKGANGEWVYSRPIGDSIVRRIIDWVKRLIAAAAL